MNQHLKKSISTTDFVAFLRAERQRMCTAKELNKWKQKKKKRKNERITREISTSNALFHPTRIYIYRHIPQTHNKALTLVVFLFGLFISLPTKSNRRLSNQLHKLTAFISNTKLYARFSNCYDYVCIWFDYKMKIYLLRFYFIIHENKKKKTIYQKQRDRSTNTKKWLFFTESNPVAVWAEMSKQHAIECQAKNHTAPAHNIVLP